MADFDYVSRLDATEPMKGPKPPLDLSHHFSRVTAARQESKIKEFYKYFQIPGIGNLAGGEFYSVQWSTPLPPTLRKLYLPVGRATMLIAIFRPPQRILLPIRYTGSPNRTARPLQSHTKRPERSERTPRLDDLEEEP